MKIMICFICILCISSFSSCVAADTKEYGSHQNWETQVGDDGVFDSLMTFLMKLGGFPSLSACIIKDNDVVWARGYGYYDRESEKEAIQRIQIKHTITFFFIELPPYTYY